MLCIHCIVFLPIRINFLQQMWLINSIPTTLFHCSLSSSSLCRQNHLRFRVNTEHWHNLLTILFSCVSGECVWKKLQQCLHSAKLHWITRKCKKKYICFGSHMTFSFDALNKRYSNWIHYEIRASVPVSTFALLWGITSILERVLFFFYLLIFFVTCF